MLWCNVRCAGVVQWCTCRATTRLHFPTRTSTPSPSRSTIFASIFSLGTTLLLHSTGKSEQLLDRACAWYRTHAWHAATLLPTFLTARPWPVCRAHSCMHSLGCFICALPLTTIRRGAYVWALPDIHCVAVACSILSTRAKRAKMKKRVLGTRTGRRTPIRSQTGPNPVSAPHAAPEWGLSPPYLAPVRRWVCMCASAC